MMIMELAYQIELTTLPVHSHSLIATDACMVMSIQILEHPRWHLYPVAHASDISDDVEVSAQVSEK